MNCGCVGEELELVESEESVRNVSLFSSDGELAAGVRGAGERERELRIREIKLGRCMQSLEVRENELRGESIVGDVI